MPELVIHVARGEVQLGSFAPAEVHELLDMGFLKPSDSSWASGMREWRPLHETLNLLAAKSSSPDWRDAVVAGSTALSRVIGRRVGTFVANVKAKATDGSGALAQAKKLALEQYLPQIQKLLAEKLRENPGETARDALRNDNAMRTLSSGLYRCLPTALRRFVSEAAFVGFCMEHRQRLLNAAHDSTIQSPPPPTKPPE